MKKKMKIINNNYKDKLLYIIIMKNILVLVESPAKCAKISKILNKIDKTNKYVVKASMGHIRDLPFNAIGIDISPDFSTFIPNYEIIKDKKELVKNLISESKKVDKVILASDLDREGEGIANHLKYILKLPENATRIIFSEITETAIKRALMNPTKINQSMVSAYETRRLLDRLIGYKLSPVVKKNIDGGFKYKISAGRTQSVVLKLICSKEQEISKFESSGYYNVNGIFENNLAANLNSKLENKKIALKFLENCKTSVFTISDIKNRNIENKAPIPFITSTLQQEANNKLHLPISEIQFLAQKLYEQGYITYIRSDCPHISPEFLPHIENYIENTFGNKYVDIKNVKSKGKSKTQDAHECIRPTNLEIKAVDIEHEKQSKLYDLIWKRTIASQMANKKICKTSVIIDANNSKYKFISEEDITIFKGYSIIYDCKDKEKSELDWIKVNAIIKKDTIIANEKYTQPPPRYTESSIVKELEKKGIGRPSTYVSSYQTNISRKYISKESKSGEKKELFIIKLLKNNKLEEIKKEQQLNVEKNKLYSTELGRKVNEFLCDNFSEFINYEFTANMEKELDCIANKNDTKDKVLSRFYTQFYPKIQQYSSSTRKELGLYEDKPIYMSKSKYGYMLCHGVFAPPKKKPLIVSITDEQFKNLNLEEAIKLLKTPINKYPKEIGVFNNKKMVLCKGPYGLYIKYNSKNYSVKAEKDVKFEDAVDIIRNTDKNRYPKKLGKHKGKNVYINNGPYGYYLTYNKKNYKIKSSAEIKLEEAIKLIK